MRESPQSNLFVWVALLAVAIFNLFPFYWMVTSSFKSSLEVVSYPATLVPQAWTTDAYRNIWLQEGFVAYFRNSLIVSLSTALLSSGVGLFAAYGFSRFKFKGRMAWMSLFLGSQMLPGVLLVGAYFRMLTFAGLYDTLFGLILAQTTITLPFSVWMLKGYIDTVPAEIDNAAMIDGANRLQILLRIIAPNIIPGFVATATFAFLLAWGDLLWALCLIEDQAKQTMTLGITRLIGQFRVQWSEIMAATVIGSVIPATLYVFLQKYLVQGFTGSAVKD
ncbi:MULTISPECIES: carbohydrate ABC transporter permease [unclassified Chelatococcus]|uniref:carbohydrate ABC transporter permease n=1 Tax=unclassified Chelatococcus TaxID=2638111 RepID=UPI001BCE1477|nr:MULTISPECIES: carbohydrate ABC transporter permease [unclassified Chelatococcus]MBS7699600.1 carbohydrate ABC transporter permease [Chelatococcus sp. YT9]MBX3557200.1 carbohydrate ABC transporter permease [Chelatococcus sp.]